MQNVLLVSGFGVLGVLLRYVIGLAAARYLPSHFPVATFVINIVGAFLIGAIYSLGTEQGQLLPEIRIGLMVGLLGGFTTFSAYCMESIILMERGEILRASLYFIGSPLAGLVSCLAGLYLVRLMP